MSSVEKHRLKAIGSSPDYQFSSSSPATDGGGGGGGVGKNERVIKGRLEVRGGARGCSSAW